MNSETIEEVNDCIFAILGGKVSAVHRLHTLMSNDLFFIGLKYTKHKQDSEDLVQEFWMNIDDTCRKFWHMTNGHAFLCKIMANRCKMFLRTKNKLEVNKVSLEENYEIEAPNSDVAMTYEQRQLKQIFNDTFLKLNREEKIIFYNTNMEIYSIRELSKALDKSKSYIGRVKANAEQKFRDALINAGWDKEANKQKKIK